MRTYPLTSTLLCLTLFTGACGDGSTPGTTGDASTGEPGTTGDATASTTTPTGTPTTGDTPGDTGDATSLATSDATSDATTSATTGTSDAPGSTSDASSGEDPSTGAIGSTTDADTSTSDASTSDASTTDASSSSGGDEGLGQDAQDIADELAAAVDGVLYTSESDYPWTVVTIADAAPVTGDNVKEVIKDVYVPHDVPLADRAIEVKTLAFLMDPLTVPKPWWDDFYYMQAEQYAPIRAIFEMKLEQVQVFRLGEQEGDILHGAIDVFVLGQTPSGDVVGMFSIAVET